MKKQQQQHIYAAMRWKRTCLTDIIYQGKKVTLIWSLGANEFEIWVC